MTAKQARSRSHPSSINSESHVIATRITHVVPWMVGALLLFSIMPVSIRELARGGLNIFEILPIRSGVALLVLLVLLAVRPDLRIHARPRRMGLNNFRNTVHYASQFSWDTGVTGSIRLRHHHDCHQKADYDRINLRHNILDGGNPVSSFTRWQRSECVLALRGALHLVRAWSRHGWAHISLLSEQRISVRGRHFGSTTGLHAYSVNRSSRLGILRRAAGHFCPVCRPDHCFRRAAEPAF